MRYYYNMNGEIETYYIPLRPQHWRCSDPGNLILYYYISSVGCICGMRCAVSQTNEPIVTTDSAGICCFFFLLCIAITSSRRHHFIILRNYTSYCWDYNFVEYIDLPLLPPAHERINRNYEIFLLFLREGGW